MSLRFLLPAGTNLGIGPCSEGFSLRCVPVEWLRASAVEAVPRSLCGGGHGLRDEEGERRAALAFEALPLRFDGLPLRCFSEVEARSWLWRSPESRERQRPTRP